MFRKVGRMITDIYDKGDVRPLGPRSPVNCEMDSQDQLWDWTMFFPSVHVHEQRRVYMGNVGLPIHVLPEIPFYALLPGS